MNGSESEGSARGTEIEETRRAASVAQLRYRLPALDAFIIALQIKSTLGEPKKLELFLDGKLTICGNSNAFINPVIEVGVIHCRVLLEFLGLREKNGRLCSVGPNRRGDDCRIEDFDLPCVTPEEVTANGSEQALLAVFRTASKGVAHATAALTPGDVAVLITAGHEIRKLLKSHFYEKANLAWPGPGVTLVDGSTSR